MKKHTQNKINKQKQNNRKKDQTDSIVSNKA